MVVKLEIPEHIKAAREHMRAGEYHLAASEYFSAGTGPSKAYQLEAKCSLLMLHRFAVPSDDADRACAKSLAEVESDDRDEMKPVALAYTDPVTLMARAQHAAKLKRNVQWKYETDMRNVWERLVGAVDEMQPLLADDI